MKATKKGSHDRELLSWGVGTKAMHLAQTVGFISPHCCWKSCLQWISNWRLSFKIRNKLNPLNKDTKVDTFPMLQCYGLLEVLLGLPHNLSEQWQETYICSNGKLISTKYFVVLTSLSIELSFHDQKIIRIHSNEKARPQPPTSGG